MYQLVNLYQPVFRRQPKLLSARTLATIVAIVAALMLAVCFSARSTMEELRRTSANLTLNHVQLGARLDRIAPAGTVPAPAVLDDEIETLRARITERNALLHRLDDLFGNTGGGFGEVFETLARTSLSGLWLTAVRLDEDGSMRISGTAADPALVPRYLRLLAEQPSLAKLTDGSVDIERDGPESSEIDFVLSYTSQGVRP